MDKVETKVGTCPVHGAIRAERRMPRPGFPFVVSAVRRLLASSRPYRCPECGARVSVA